MRAVTRTSLVDQAIGRLREAIVSGEWPVGERIPSEPELIDTLGVARNTMREAVRALAHSGMLEVRHGDGTYVRARSETEGVLRRRLRLADLLEVVTVRRGLEVEAARQAAERHTPDDLARLTTLSRSPDRGSLDHRVTRAVDFHNALVDASHNRLLIELYQAIIGAVALGIRQATADPELSDVGTREHEELLAAIADRDADRAAQAAARHLDPLVAQVRARL
ncbi:FadR/GntR family transcriptional regulator [Actinoallomurus oryzae]|jgi:DNA-binding FadR family transcriptional regulator|uniref:FadR/GntR family transcriptional regulator n=2 Tax=Thermomonosporaceae TaxID=2012 RepID=A0ABP8R0M0_9ACTN